MRPEIMREIFDRMVGKQEFDVSELSLAEHIVMVANGDSPFVALPVFPSKAFRHGFICINKGSGIETPKDLTAKRIGVPLYTMTAAIWIRGDLQNVYGVDLSQVRWVQGAVEKEAYRPAERKAAERARRELHEGSREVVHLLCALERDLNSLEERLLVAISLLPSQSAKVADEREQVLAGDFGCVQRIRHGRKLSGAVRNVEQSLPLRRGAAVHSLNRRVSDLARRTRMDFHALRLMTVSQLRDVAKTIDGLTGYTQMHKDQLLAAVCKELGIPMHDHHEVVGVDKAAIKARIRQLRQERAAALEAQDRKQFKHVLHEIHRLKRALRRATV